MAGNVFEKLIRFIVKAHESHEDAVDCEICSEKMDCLADQVARGADIQTILPAMERHLECCPDCKEEFDALVAIIRAEYNGVIPEES